MVNKNTIGATTQQAGNSSYKVMIVLLKQHGTYY